MSETTRGVEPEATGIRRGLTNYGDPEFSLFIRGAYARGSGLTDDDLARPVVGIAQTWSEFNPCHRHLREVAEAVKRGVWQAGGLPPRVPDDLARRDLPLPHQHALPKPDGDGHRGDDSRPADGRRGPPRRVRQDPARPAHGRRERRPTGHRRHRRAHARRPIRRCASGGVHGLPPRLERAPRGYARRGPARSGPGRALPVHRHLHGHGHGEHDGRAHRGAGPDAPRHGRYPRASRAQTPARGGGRATDRRDGAGRPPAEEYPHPRGVRERRPGPDGARRIHQRCRPPYGDRGACGRAARPRRLRSAGADDAARRQRPPLGHLPHGRPCRGRWHPRGDG